MTLLRVRALDPDHPTQLATLVLEELGGQRALGFVIPMNEANRLARVLGPRRCCAPIYDLTLRLVAHMAARLVRAVIDAEEDGITAALVLERDGREVWLACHPADAVALATMTAAPIHASAAAMDQSRPINASALARWLERVRPDDFARDEER